MCKSETSAWSIGVALVLAGATGVHAQFVPNSPYPQTAPYIRPALSPYLNLLRGGNPAANYYLGVQTEFDRRYQQLLRPPGPQAALPTPEGYLDSEKDDVPERRLPPTGHSAGFMTFGPYFQMPNQRPYYPLNPQQAQRPLQR